MSENLIYLKNEEKRNIILNDSLETIQKACLEQAINLKDIRKYIGLLFLADKNKFYSLTSFLKSYYNDFNATTFGTLYSDAINKNITNFYKIKALDFPIDKNTLLFKTLEICNIKKNFSDKHAKLITDVVECYGEDRAAIIHNLETFTEKWDYHHLDYFLLRSIYRSNKPTNVYKLDRLYMSNLSRLLDIFSAKKQDLTEKKEYAAFRKLYSTLVDENVSDLSFIKSYHEKFWFQTLSKDILSENLSLSLEKKDKNDKKMKI